MSCNPGNILATRDMKLQVKYPENIPFDLLHHLTRDTVLSVPDQSYVRNGV